MHDMQRQWFLMNAVSVSLSCGSTRLHCAKTAEWIKIPFGVNSPGGPTNTVLHRGPDPPQIGKGKMHSMQPLPNYFGLLPKL